MAAVGLVSNQLVSIFFFSLFLLLGLFSVSPLEQKKDEESSSSPFLCGPALLGGAHTFHSLTDENLL